MASVVSKVALLCKDPRLNAYAQQRLQVVLSVGYLAAGTSSSAVWQNLVNILLAQTPAGAFPACP
jgi:hypothetical protein